MPEAIIASFVLRFIQEHAPETGSSAGVWHGIIRHVQTSEEIRFIQMEDALAFIARYVDITGADRGSRTTPDEQMKGEKGCD